jgi:hypothetical protein
MDIGWCWAAGPAPEMDDADLDLLVDPQTAAAIRSQESTRETEFPVLPENWPALQLFLSCATQWRYSPAGSLLGIDYQALAVVMDMQQVPGTDRPARLSQVQWIERGVLEALRKR